MSKKAIQAVVVDPNEALAADETTAALTTRAEDIPPLAMPEAEALARLQGAVAAPPEAFRDVETGFWSPQKPGEFIVGIYGGMVQVSSRIKQHRFACLDSQGLPYERRLNHTTALAAPMERVAIGDLTRVTYNGETKTTDGDRLKQWSVAVLVAPK